VVFNTNYPLHFTNAWSGGVAKPGIWSFSGASPLLSEVLGQILAEGPGAAQFQLRYERAFDVCIGTKYHAENGGESGLQMGSVAPL
jgi:hypothetical protein